MGDDDLIRRGDALKALDWGDIYGRNAQQCIASLPAVAMVNKLVNALALIESVTVHSGGEIHGVTIDHYRTAFETVQQEARITLDEIGYGFAITEASNG